MPTFPHSSVWGVIVHWLCCLVRLSPNENNNNNNNDNNDNFINNNKCMQNTSWQQKFLIISYSSDMHQ
jgi:hypothetical protein